MKLLKSIILKIIYGITISIVYLRYLLTKWERKTVGLVLEEFFHQDLRGFGGYAMTAKNISDYYNLHPQQNLQINILLATKLPIAPKPCVKKYHHAKVLFRPVNDDNPNIDLIRYLWSFAKNPSQVLLTIEYYETYHYVLKRCSGFP